MLDHIYHVTQSQVRVIILTDVFWRCQATGNIGWRLERHRGMVGGSWLPLPLGWLTSCISFLLLYSKWPQIWCFRTIGIYYLIVWRPEAWFWYSKTIAKWMEKKWLLSGIELLYLHYTELFLICEEILPQSIYLLLCCLAPSPKYVFEHHRLSAHLPLRGKASGSSLLSLLFYTNSTNTE